MTTVDSRHTSGSGAPATGDRSSTSKREEQIATITAADLPLWITPMQAVAWVMTREAAVVLRASFDPHDVDRATAALDDTSLWCDGQPGLSLLSIELRVLGRDPSYQASLRSDERAVHDLVGALRRGAVVASAEPYDRHTDRRGTRVTLNTLDWAALTLGEIRHGMRQLDLFNVMSGAAQGRAWAVQWASLLIDRASLIKFWPEKPPTTVAAEARLREWLVEQMKADPPASRSKNQMRASATAAGFIGVRAFDRAWAAAAQVPGVSESWGRAGRKSTH